MRQRVAAFAAEEADNLRYALGGLRQVVAMLSGIEGRKSIIYVSSGLPMVPGIGLMHDYAMTFHDQTILSLRGRYDQTRLFHELTSLANAQDVSLYSIDATGSQSPRWIRGRKCLLQGSHRLVHRFEELFAIAGLHGGGHRGHRGRQHQRRHRRARADLQ